MRIEFKTSFLLLVLVLLFFGCLNFSGIPGFSPPPGDVLKERIVSAPTRDMRDFSTPLKSDFVSLVNDPLPSLVNPPAVDLSPSPVQVAVNDSVSSEALNQFAQSHPDELEVVENEWEAGDWIPPVEPDSTLPPTDTPPVDIPPTDFPPTAPSDLPTILPDSNPPLVDDSSFELFYNLSLIAAYWRDTSSLGLPSGSRIKRIGEPLPREAPLLTPLEPLETFIPLVTSQNPPEFYSVVGTGCQGIQDVKEIPLFDQPQQVNVYVYFPENNETAIFGLNVNPTQEEPIVPVDARFENPTMNVYATQPTLAAMFASSDPLTTMASYWRQDFIYVEGTNPQTMAMVTAAQQAAKAAAFVEKDPCIDIQRRFLELQAQLDAFPCNEIRAALENAQQEQATIKDALSNLTDLLSKREGELKKAQDAYNQFLDQVLNDPNYQLTPPADPANWNYVNYERYGTTVYFKGNGSKLVEAHQRFANDFKELRKKAESSFRQLEEAKALAEGLSADEQEIASRIAELEEKLTNCERQKKDVEFERDQLARDQADCIRTAEEARLVVEHSDAFRKKVEDNEWRVNNGDSLISTFDGLDQEIKEKQSTLASAGKVISNSDCDRVKALQEAARIAQSNATTRLNEARQSYESAKRNFDDGYTAEAAALLDRAESVLNEAIASANNALDLARAAIAAKQSCALALSQAQKSEEEKAAYLDHAKKLYEGTATDSTIKKYDKPYAISEARLRTLLYMELEEGIQREIVEVRGCDCPMKGMMAAHRLMGEVFSDFLFQVGLAAIKAPIDALTPEGTIGTWAQRFASYTLTYLGSDSLGDAAKDIVISELVGKILPETEIPIIDKPVGEAAGTAAGEGFDALVEKLNDAGVQSWTFEKNSKNIRSRSCGEFDCGVKMIVYYNPKTHYVVAFIKTTCCPGIIVMSFQVDDEGLVDGELLGSDLDSGGVEIKYIN